MIDIRGPDNVAEEREETVIPSLLQKNGVIGA